MQSYYICSSDIGRVERILQIPEMGLRPTQKNGSALRRDFRSAMAWGQAFPPMPLDFCQNRGRAGGASLQICHAAIRGGISAFCLGVTEGASRPAYYELKTDGADSAVSRRTASRMPLIKETASSPENCRASSSASSITIGASNTFVLSS